MWEEDVLCNIGFTEKTVQYIIENCEKVDTHQPLDYWVKHYIEMYFSNIEDKCWRTNFE